MGHATGTGKYELLLERCRSLEPVPTAVAHPCEETALAGALEAGAKKLITPILVGPIAKIREVAEKSGLDLGSTRIVDAPHSHAAAATAVALVRKGEAELLMKGSLHTDELLGAVVARETGLRTGRRLSHVFVMDVPTYHKVLIVTDAAINIAPTLDDKVDICQNAIDFVVSLDVPEAQGRHPGGGGDRELEDARDHRRRRAVQDGGSPGRSPMAFSMARSPSTTRSARQPRRSKASTRRSPETPTSCWFPTSRRATCWPSS